MLTLLLRHLVFDRFYLIILDMFFKFIEYVDFPSEGTKKIQQVKSAVKTWERFLFLLFRDLI